MGPFVELSDVEEEKMKGPARQKQDHTVPLRAKREIKGQFQVHSSSPSMYLGTRESGFFFFIIVLLEKSPRESPKPGGSGQFSNAHGLCSEITTKSEYFCRCLGVY